MLSGPITQDAGITEMSTREEEREQGNWAGGRKMEKETVVKGEEEEEEVGGIKMHEDELESNRLI